MQLTHAALVHDYLLCAAGVFSPTLRSHSHKSSPPRAIWTIPNPHFSIMRHYYRRGKKDGWHAPISVYHSAHLLVHVATLVNCVSLSWMRFVLLFSPYRCRLRTRLVPYIATAQRIAYDTGVQVVRPMYYAHNTVDSAYSMTAQHQYYFGPDMWTAPIAAPASNASAQFGNLTTWTFWMPPGECSL